MPRQLIMENRIRVHTGRVRSIALCTRSRMKVLTATIVWGVLKGHGLEGRMLYSVESSLAV
jgi:hypothetical protein